MWIQRDIHSALNQAAQERPAIVVAGARQTGKTSLCRHFFPNHSFVSLDLPRLAEEAEYSGETFLANHPAPLIIDEAQYAPKLFRYLKHEIDKHRESGGLYVLTGSQKFTLMENISESLSGRIAVLNLHSLSLAEIEKFRGKKVEGKELLGALFRGGYPELYSKNLNTERFYSDYVATYLERDVRQVLQVKNLREFDRFMRLAASRTGQILSLQTFSADLGLSPNTVKSWLSVLEASQIIYLLEPYYENIGKRLTKTPKLYFLDTGLACFLAGFRSPSEVAESSLLGALFETLVFGQMMRQFSNQGMMEKIYFYRDHQGNEIDFVIPVGNDLKLYECKYSEDPGPVKIFHHTASFFGKRKIISKSVICPVRGHRQTSEGVWIEDAVDLKSFKR